MLNGKDYNIMTTLEASKALSTMSATPIAFTCSETSTMLVAWRGQILTPELALNVISAIVLNLYSSPSMKEKAFEKYKFAIGVSPFPYLNPTAHSVNSYFVNKIKSDLHNNNIEVNYLECIDAIRSIVSRGK